MEYTDRKPTGSAIGKHETLGAALFVYRPYESMWIVQVPKTRSDPKEHRRYNSKDMGGLVDRGWRFAQVTL